ncbi:MAG: hypothetical protein ACREFC_01550 [Stellaceae bacterium]
MEPMRPAFPIAIMSFDRPHYLGPVLAALKAQTVPVDPSRIFLFQDGYRSKTGRDIADPRRIEECVALFQSHFPGARALVARDNLGVALNFARAEEFVFEDTGAQAGYFFEDDLVPAPPYLTALGALTELALANRRVAYVAAYGYHHTPSGEQRKAPRRLIPMIHRWGFALTRRQWAAQKPLLAPYLDIVSRADYRRRDERAIRAYYRSLGYGAAGTTQDGMKDVASCVLGTAKVMTNACFGRYIGETGLHSNRKFYRREKFGEVEIYPDEIASFDPPDDAELDGWIAASRAQARVFARPSLLGRVRGVLGLSSRIAL